MIDKDDVRTDVRTADLAIRPGNKHAPDEESHPDGGDLAPQTPRIPVAEWLVAGLGVILVTTTVGFMLYRAILGNESPPIITVRVDQVITNGDGYLVTFRVENTGDTTAASLTVVGELSTETGTVETSTVTIGYVPSRSTRHGGLLFTEDPKQLDLTLRAAGYERP